MWEVPSGPILHEDKLMVSKFIFCEMGLQSLMHDSTPMSFPLISKKVKFLCSSKEATK